jgi:hypothetical protein
MMTTAIGLEVHIFTALMEVLGKKKPNFSQVMGQAMTTSAEALQLVETVLSLEHTAMMTTELLQEVCISFNIMEVLGNKKPNYSQVMGQSWNSSA